MNIETGIICLNTVLAHLHIGLSVIKEGKDKIPKEKLLDLEVSLSDAMVDMDASIEIARRYILRKKIADVKIQQQFKDLASRYNAFRVEKDAVMTYITLRRKL